MGEEEEQAKVGKDDILLHCSGRHKAGGRSDRSAVDSGRNTVGSHHPTRLDEFKRVGRDGLTASEGVRVTRHEVESQLIGHCGGHNKPSGGHNDPVGGHTGPIGGHNDPTLLMQVELTEGDMEYKVIDEGSFKHVQIYILKNLSH